MKALYEFSALAIRFARGHCLVGSRPLLDAALEWERAYAFDAGFSEAVRMLNSKIADEYHTGVGDSGNSPADWALWLEEQRSK